MKTEDGHRMYRLRLKIEDFLVHGFTEGCPGCQAIIVGTTARGHREACRSRMESALDKTDDGRQRREKQELKENEALARKLQEEEDERMTKKAKTGDDVPARCASAAAASSPSSKRWADVEEEDDVNNESKAPFAKRHRGLQNSRGEKRELDNEDMSGDDCQDEERPHKYMAITNMEENPYQDDMKWTVSEVSDMCIPDDPIIKNTVDGMAYFDENTWEILDQQLVKEAEKAEIARFKKMGVYSYLSRSEALNDPDGSFVKVKWVRTNKGTAAQSNIRCQLVAQEIGYGQRTSPAHLR